MSTDLNTFANQWIREGMTATSIEGFGPGSPPPPPLDFEDLDTGRIVRPEPEPEPSPLVALAQAVPDKYPATNRIITQAAMLTEPSRPAAGQSLSVLGDAGFYKGTYADLSKHDQAAIGRIILESAHRRLREQLAEVSRAAPRRVRKPAMAPAPAPVAVAPKRRGRPPKAQPGPF